MFRGVRRAVTVTFSMACTFPVMESLFSCADTPVADSRKQQNKQSHGRQARLFFFILSKILMNKTYAFACGSFLESGR